MERSRVEEGEGEFVTNRMVAEQDDIVDSNCTPSLAASFVFSESIFIYLKLSSTHLMHVLPFFFVLFLWLDEKDVGGRGRLQDMQGIGGDGVVEEDVGWVEGRRLVGGGTFG